MYSVLPYLTSSCPVNRRIRALSLFLAAVPVSVKAQEGPEGGDLEVIRGRVLAELIAPDASAAAGFLAKLDVRGRFSDLDYAEVSDAHLRRIETLCVAYRRPEHALSGKDELQGPGIWHPWRPAR